MAPILYYNVVSPPVRAVLLTERALGIKLEKKEISIKNGDHLTTEYLKFPMFFLGVKEISQKKADALIKGLVFLESFLENREWMAGDQLTIADLCIGASVSSMEALESLIPVSLDKYPRLQGWMNRMKTLPYYEEANGTGLQKLKASVKQSVAE
ncbi:Glutathione S transferase E6 [Carabus blaptoides fortunei]